MKEHCKHLNLKGQAIYCICDLEHNAQNLGLVLA